MIIRVKTNRTHRSVWSDMVWWASSCRFRLRCTIYADGLELWLCYMIRLGVSECYSPCLVGLELDVRIRLMG